MGSSNHSWACWSFPVMCFFTTNSYWGLMTYVPTPLSRVQPSSHCRIWTECFNWFNVSRYKSVRSDYLLLKSFWFIPKIHRIALKNHNISPNMCVWKACSQLLSVTWQQGNVKAQQWLLIEIFILFNEIFNRLIAYFVKIDSWVEISRVRHRYSTYMYSFRLPCRSFTFGELYPWISHDFHHTNQLLICFLLI